MTINSETSSASSILKGLCPEKIGGNEVGLSGKDQDTYLPNFNLKLRLGS